MPVHESVALIFVTIAFFAGVWGVTDTVLKHRRKMAEIKFGRSDREVQLSAEGATFSRDEMTALLDLAEAGVAELVAAQKAAI